MLGLRAAQLRSEVPVWAKPLIGFGGPGGGFGGPGGGFFSTGSSSGLPLLLPVLKPPPGPPKPPPGPLSTAGRLWTGGISNSFLVF